MKRTGSKGCMLLNVYQQLDHYYVCTTEFDFVTTSDGHLDGTSCRLEETSAPRLRARRLKQHKRQK